MPLSLVNIRTHFRKADISTLMMGGEKYCRKVCAP